MTEAPGRRRPATATGRFSSQDWFDAPHRIDMAGLYLERFLNYGLTPEELRSGRPIVGVAKSGGDLTPCDRVHLDTAKRVRDGIRDAGGIAMKFPFIPSSRTAAARPRRWTAT